MRHSIFMPVWHQVQWEGIQEIFLVLLISLVHKAKYDIYHIYIYISFFLSHYFLKLYYYYDPLRSHLLFFVFFIIFIFRYCRPTSFTSLSFNHPILFLFLSYLLQSIFSLVFLRSPFVVVLSSFSSRIFSRLFSSINKCYFIFY